MIIWLCDFHESRKIVIVQSMNWNKRFLPAFDYITVSYLYKVLLCFQAAYWETIIANNFHQIQISFPYINKTSPNFTIAHLQKVRNLNCKEIAVVAEESVSVLVPYDYWLWLYLKLLQGLLLRKIVGEEWSADYSKLWCYFLFYSLFELRAPFIQSMKWGH